MVFPPTSAVPDIRRISIPRMPSALSSNGLPHCVNTIRLPYAREKSTTVLSFGAVAFALLLQRLCKEHYLKVVFALLRRNIFWQIFIIYMAIAIILGIQRSITAGKSSEATRSLDVGNRTGRHFPSIREDILLLPDDRHSTDMIRCRLLSEITPFSLITHANCSESVLQPNPHILPRHLTSGSNSNHHWQQRSRVFWTISSVRSHLLTWYLHKAAYHLWIRLPYRRKIATGRAL